MPNNLPSINLAKNKQVPLFDKFMNWALTIGRLIVIATEVVAVIVFIYRFSLDERIADLHSTIKQKQNLISALKNDENKYRNLQDRLVLASTFSTKADEFKQTITGIMNFMSNQIRVNNFILNKDQVNLTIEVASASSLASFIDSLKKSPNVKSISIDSIESKPSAGLSVNITVMLK